MLRSITDTTATKITTTQTAGLNATAICNLSATEVLNLTAGQGGASGAAGVDSSRLFYSLVSGSATSKTALRLCVIGARTASRSFRLAGRGTHIYSPGSAPSKTATGHGPGGSKETRGKPLFDPARWCSAALTPPNQILPRGHCPLLEYLPLRLPQHATGVSRARPAVSRNVGVIRSQRLRFGAAVGRSRAPGTDVGLFSPCRKEGQPPAASFAITNRDPGNFY